MKIKVNPRSKLVSATKILSDLGIEVKVDSVARQTTLAQIEDLKVLGEEEAACLVDVVSRINTFNEVASSQIKEMRTGDRYETIRENFESILEDTERMVKQVSGGGKLSIIAKIQNKLIKMRRGSVEARFDELRNTAEQVFADAEEQIKREYVILDAYRDFRESLKEAVVVSRVLYERAKEREQGFVDAFAVAQKNLDAANEKGLGLLEIGALEIERDRAQRSLEIEKRRVQAAANLSEQLLLSSGISDGVMTRYAQTTEVKETVQRQSATFYTANNGVLTTLTATFKQLHGLHEQTQTIKEMKAGTENAIRRLNSLGSDIQTRALQAAYETGIDPQVLRDLYTKTVEFKKQQNELEEKLRVSSEKNYEETRKIITEGQKKLAESLIPQAARLASKAYTAAPTEAVMEITVPELSAESVAAARAEAASAQAKKKMKASV